jgi:DNA-binding transcriptional LysR family regulator
VAGLQTFLAFAETVKHGSFAGAARELGLSSSAVAKNVARLEADLGLRLFHRTTRQVALTSDGRGLYERCRRIVEEIEALRDDAEGVRGEPSGTIRLNAPTVLGRIVVVPVLARLLQRHPRLGLDVSLSDAYVDVVKEGFDAVVRVGVLRDSTLVGRKVADQHFVVVASPDYLARHGVPRTPDDLARHRTLAFRMPSTGRVRPWGFTERGRAREVAPAASVAMDDGDALLAAAIAGLGLMQLPNYIAGEALARRAVVEVLAKYRSAPIPISVVYPSTRRMTPRLRVLIDALAAADWSDAPRSRRRRSAA